MALTPTANQLAILQLNQAMLGQAAGTTVLAAGLPTFTSANAYAKVLFDANSAWNTLDATQAYTKLLTSLTAGTAATAADINALVAAVVAETGSTKLLKTIPEGLALLTVALYNFASSTTTNVWTDAAKQLVNKVAVDSYYTLDQGGAAPSTAAAANVTANVATVAAAEALIGAGGVITPATSSFVLTTGADIYPGTMGNDTITGTDLTLTAGDRINWGGGGDDVLKISSAAAAAKLFSAFEMTGVKTLVTTADIAGVLNTFDLSGTTGLTLLNDLNSVGNIKYDQVTSLANVTVENMTAGATMAVAYQNTVVAGTADAISLNLINNYNANATNTLTVGSVGTANAGVETINAAVSVANTTIGQLDSNITNLNITGDKAFTITTALNNTVRSIDASTFSGNLTLTVNNTTAAAAPMTIKGGTAVDTLTMTGVLANATITTGAGADVLLAGMGDDTIDMGAGDDRADFAANGITVADTFTGGAGNDNVRVLTTDTISRSEAQKFTDTETFTLLGAGGSSMVVTNNLLTTITGADRFTVNTASATGGNTIDISEVTVTNTSKFALAASTATTGTTAANNETVIAADAVINANAILAFGTGTADTMRVMDGARITHDDLTNVSGLEIINLRSTGNTPQTWNIQLTDAFIRSSTLNVAAAGVAATAGSITINVGDDVPAGSVLNIDASNLTAAEQLLLVGAVNVYRTANLTVNVTGTTSNVFNVLGSLLFTTNADTLSTMTGTAGDDVFIANYVNEVNAADSIAGLGQTTADTLRLNFAVNGGANALFTNATPTIGQLSIYDTAITGIERVTFNNIADTVATTTTIADQISFVDNSIAAMSTTGTITFYTGSGADAITGNATIANNYSMGAGNNTFTSGAAAVANGVTTGAGTDNFIFAQSAYLAAGDVIAASTGTDTIQLQSTNRAGGAVYNLSSAALTGIDVWNITSFAADKADSFVVVNGDITQADTPTNLTINVTDSNAAANTAAIVNASAVVAGATGLHITATVTGGAGLATSAADVRGGSGADILTIAGGATSYVVEGNAGADIINITNGGTAVSVLYTSPNDGGAQGTNTGYDVVTGFHSGTDVVLFNRAGYLATDTVGTGAATALVLATDAPANFTAAVNALRLTQLGAGMTDTDILSLATVATKANVIGITAATTQGGFIIANGATQTAIYMYVEQDGTANNIATSELRIIGLFDANNIGAAGTDLAYQ